MTGAGDSDQRLMERYAGGDGAAFEALYERHEMRTWRYLLSHVGNRAIADELMQDVWFAVAREAARYQARAKFTTWLFTIAHNRMVDVLRMQRTTVSLEAIAKEAGAIDLISEPRPGPLAATVAFEEADALARALAELPPEQRDAFLMQVEGDLGVDDIAAITGVSFETAKSRLRYARAKLRGLLKEYA